MKVMRAKTKAKPKAMKVMRAKTKAMKKNTKMKKNAKKLSSADKMKKLRAEKGNIWSNRMCCAQSRHIQLGSNMVVGGLYGDRLGSCWDPLAILKQSK
jgi:protein subunit release factor A